MPAQYVEIDATRVAVGRADAFQRAAQLTIPIMQQKYARHQRADLLSVMLPDIHEHDLSYRCAQRLPYLFESFLVVGHVQCPVTVMFARQTPASSGERGTATGVHHLENARRDMPVRGARVLQVRRGANRLRATSC